MGTLSGSRRVSLSGCRSKELEGELGVGGIVFGAAGGERGAVASEGLGVNGGKDEEVVLEQGRNDRSLTELDANGDGSAVKPAAKLVGPITEGSWRVRDDGALALSGARSAKADVVLFVRPVDADEGGERNGFLHGESSCTMRGRDMQSRTQRRRYGEPVARLSLSIRYGQRHTRRREAELLSIAGSRLCPYRISASGFEPFQGTFGVDAMQAVALAVHSPRGELASVEGILDTAIRRTWVSQRAQPESKWLAALGRSASGLRTVSRWSVMPRTCASPDSSGCRRAYRLEPVFRLVRRFLPW
jgi:hypothetical protein